MPNIKHALLTVLLGSMTICNTGCDAKKIIRCAFTDIAVDVKSSDTETRGLAVECALSRDASDIAPLVPSLLPLFNDASVYRRVYSGGGIIGFGEAGERELVVAQIAIRAVQKAKPIEANIKPLIQTLVKTSNIMHSSEYAGLYGDPKTTIIVLIQLLEHEFRDADLGPKVAIELRKQLPAIKNPIVINDMDFMQSLSALAEGKVFDPYSDIANSNSAAKQPKKIDGRHGLTWGSETLNNLASDSFVAKCHSKPIAPMDNQYNGSCNPYEGDTVCTASLPILCFSPTQNTLQPSTFIMGTLLASRTTADAQCAKQFGTDWRMAEHHDGDWGITAKGKPPAIATRFWVAINDQNANCWDK